jgi:hypothetical protein
MLCGNVKTDMIEHMMFEKRTWYSLSPMQWVAGNGSAFLDDGASRAKPMRRSGRG